MKKYYETDIQNKILTRISYDSNQTTPVGTNKNDECFTGRQDIANEILNGHDRNIFSEFNSYKQAGVFKGKRIICPCDWDAIPEMNGYPVKATKSPKEGRWITLELVDQDSGEHRMFEKTFDDVKQLLEQGAVETTQPELVKWTKCNFVLTFLGELADGEIESLTFSGYNPLYNSRGLDFRFDNNDSGKKEVKSKIKELQKDNPDLNYEIIAPFEGNDFKYTILESEGIGLSALDVDYNNYDIVVTNPPFSLYDSLLKKWLSYDHLDLVLLAPFLNRVTPNVGLPLWLGQHPELLPYQWGKSEENAYKKGIYLGFERHASLSFENPTYLSKKKLVAVDWITTFDFIQKQVDRTRLKNNVELGLYKDKFDFYKDITLKDGTRPIRLNNFRSLPDDYYGWFITSIGILDVLSNDEFEWYGTNYKSFNNSEIGQNIIPINHKSSDKMININGRQGFHGILARRKDSMLPEGTTREQFTQRYIQWYNDYISGNVIVNFENYSSEEEQHDEEN